MGVSKLKAESSRAPYYINLHLGDYERDCVELSILQDGAYFRLMRWYYSSGKPIPNDLDRIYRRLHATSIEEQTSVRYVLENFFQLDGPVWRQKRIDQEIADYAKRCSSAKLSAETRWKKSNKNNECIDAKALPTQCEGNANHNHNHNINTLVQKLDGFEEFWQAYPKKKSKGAAIKAWLKIKPSKALQDKILAVLPVLANSRDWTKDSRQFCPLPATWLNAGGWDDEVISSGQPSRAIFD